MQGVFSAPQVASSLLQKGPSMGALLGTEAVKGSQHGPDGLGLLPCPLPGCVAVAVCPCHAF